MGKTASRDEKAKTESLLTKMIEEALSAHHRRLVVIFSEGAKEVLIFLVLKHKALKMPVGGEEDGIVFVGYSDCGRRRSAL